MIQTDHRVTRCIHDFNDNNIQDFNTKLSFETWENVFDDEGTDINRIFNNFHNTFLGKKPFIHRRNTPLGWQKA